MCIQSISDRTHTEDARRQTCPACGSLVFWPSRTGPQVCARCHPTPLQALQVLANQRKCATTYGDRTGMDGGPAR